MFNIIPLILIVAGLGVIIVIVGRKFSALANLDVDSMPAEKEARFREKILTNRLKRNFLKHYFRVARVAAPLGQALGRISKNAFDKLVSFREESAAEETPEENREQAAKKLLFEAEELAEAENYDEAEKKYIAAIGFDSRNIAAFRGLGLLYYERKDFNEARQTLEHALRLAEKDFSENGGAAAGGNVRPAGIYSDLALVCRAMEVFEEAAGYVSHALDFEPNNPRYLDMKLELSIIRKDKPSALEAYDRLRGVNPDNNKLPEFKKQIREL